MMAMPSYLPGSVFLAAVLCTFIMPKTQLQGISVGGGADSTFFSALNIPTICSFGPVGEFAHTLKEYVIEEDLYRRTVLLADCLLKMDESIFQP